MAIYKRNYKNFTGARTQTWSRFLVLARFGFARVFQSKFLLLFVIACCFYPIGCALYIYFSHNETFLGAFNIPAMFLPRVDGRFFYYYSIIQGALSYLMTAFVAPALITPDFTNGAMPLYFSRPFSRAEYATGKISVLLVMLSLITWIPGALLFAIQASIEGWSWTHGNFWLAESIVLGQLVWIIVLSLLGLALSAWVKWKIGAGALVLAVIFAGAGFGAAINSLMRTNYGSLIDLTQVVHTIWADLFRYDSGTEMSVTNAWTVLAVTAIVSIFLLAKRIRPFEVIK